MAERDDGARPGGAAAGEPERRKVCCLVSEILEEAGLDRRKARALKRQVLEGVILLCRWQLERMSEGPDTPPRTRRGPRKVAVQ